MCGCDWADEYGIRLYRKGIQMVNSQPKSMGIERLRARTNVGSDLKIHASLIALCHTQVDANWQSRSLICRNRGISLHRGNLLLHKAPCGSRLTTLVDQAVSGGEALFEGPKP